MSENKTILYYFQVQHLKQKFSKLNSLLAYRASRVVQLRVKCLILLSHQALYVISPKCYSRYFHRFPEWRAQRTVGKALLLGMRRNEENSFMTFTVHRIHGWRHITSTCFRLNFEHEVALNAQKSENDQSRCISCFRETMRGCCRSCFCMNKS